MTEDRGGTTSSVRGNQSDKALFSLRALIMNGEFRGGDRLSEVVVADRLGISRTPLRKAMDRLTGEGFLERIETGGCRIATFTRSDIVDAIELRGVIEGTAARMAAERGVSDAQLSEARRILDRIDRTLDRGDTDDFEGGDFEGYVAGNELFHGLLARLPGSSLVEREVARANRLPFASPSAFLQGQEPTRDLRESLRSAQRQHRAIVDAIENREGARAEALTREHARLARAHFDHITREQPLPATYMPGLALVTPE